MDVPDDATSLEAVLIGDGSSSGYNATFDRAFLFVGEGIADTPISL
jgi:hypothetical protein